jgi:hypothetical protein
MGRRWGGALAGKRSRGGELVGEKLGGALAGGGAWRRDRRGKNRGRSLGGEIVGERAGAAMCCAVSEDEERWGTMEKRYGVLRKQRGWAHGVLVPFGASREQARGQHGSTDFSQSIGRRIPSIFLSSFGYFLKVHESIKNRPGVI